MIRQLDRVHHASAVRDNQDRQSGVECNLGKLVPLDNLLLHDRAVALDREIEDAELTSRRRA